MRDASSDLDALLAGAAADLAEVTVDETAPGDVVRRYRRGSTEFAQRGSGWVDLRLPADIAEVVLRVPDTAASERGPGWVRVTPRADDAHADDRIRAWFVTAWRHTPGGDGGPGRS